MGLNIKDEEAVKMLSEVARRIGRSKTATVRELARAELARLDAAAQDRAQNLTAFFESEIWSGPQEPMPKAEIEELLGIDSEGAGQS